MAIFSSCCAAAALAACDDATRPTEPAPLLPPDVRAFVTGTAAQHVDANGHYLLRVPTSPGYEPIASTERAGALAMAWLRTFFWHPAQVLPIPGGQSVHDALEAMHGGPIAWRELRPGFRTAYLAETPYDELSPEVPLPVRRFFGPTYLVPLEANGVLAVCLELAAYMSDFEIDDSGRLVFPRSSGNEFSSNGVPRESRIYHPIWPEEATKLAWESTGARTAEVPRLIKAGERWAPIFSRWEVVLDREVRLRDRQTGEERSSRTVYIGIRYRAGAGGRPEPYAEWSLPAREQPTEEVIDYHTSGPNRERRTIVIRFLSGIPVRFDPVVPLRD